jgi:hypothetical protein
VGENIEISPAYSRNLILNHENCARHTARLLYEEVAKMGKNMSQNFALANCFNVAVQMGVE